MKRLILILIFICGFFSKVHAFEIVYPKSDKVELNSSKTFFIGSTNPDTALFINGEFVKVNESGAFAQSVSLQNGENVFIIKSGDIERKYIIKKNPPACNSRVSFTDYRNEIFAVVKRNGTPLRSTPVQFGINRLSHLQKNVELLIDGENEELYRVVLSPSEYAWISKSDVEIKENLSKEKNIINCIKKENDNFYIYEFKMSAKAPYSIEEKDFLTLKIYNLSNYPDSTAIFNIKLNQKLMGYSTFYKGNNLILKIRKEQKIFNTNKPLNKINIVIDAGHGGKELGAVGCCGNYEKEFNLKVSKYLAKELKLMGANVLMTRNYDKFVSLNNRVKYTNSKNGEIFVSIHANSLPDEIDPMTRSGSSVYYYYPQAKQLSESILSSMITNLGTNNEGVKQASFAVVRNTCAVSVLVEVAYLINPYDNEMLMNDEFRQNCAKAIAQGIKNYTLNEN